jgi:hypothetical protein
MPAHLIMPAYIKIPMTTATVTNSQRKKKNKMGHLYIFCKGYSEYYATLQK